MSRCRRPWQIFTLILAGGLAFLSTGLAPAAGGEAAADFRRGIGISTMAWAEVEPRPSRAFVFPPFSDRILMLDELQALQRMGFDFVRFAVDPGPFLQFQGSQREALDRMLMERVHLVLKSGLSVIVDFHPSDLHPDYTAKALTAGWDSPVFQAYLRLLERTAGRLDALRSNKVALEFMNEPPVKPYVWQPMLEAAYAAVRRRSVNLLTVVQGGEPSGEALMQMRTAPFAGDRAVLFTFHYYDPYQFTHQGAPWNAARYLADVPYPARARPLQDSLEATAAAIGSTDLPQQQKLFAYRDAQQRLESYRRSGFDRDAIAKTFEQISDWARSQGIPSNRVLLGEFGARKTALQLQGVGAAERAQWFSEVREQAEAHGFGWAVWVYRGGGGFALAASKSSNGIEAGIEQALGLTFRSREKTVDMPAAEPSNRVP